MRLIHLFAYFSFHLDKLLIRRWSDWHFFRILSLWRWIPSVFIILPPPASFGCPGSWTAPNHFTSLQASPHPYINSNSSHEKFIHKQLGLSYQFLIPSSRSGPIMQLLNCGGAITSIGHRVVWPLLYTLRSSIRTLVTSSAHVHLLHALFLLEVPSVGGSSMPTGSYQEKPAYASSILKIALSTTNLSQVSVSCSCWLFVFIWCLPLFATL
jgi:hypothetical protein